MDDADTIRMTPNDGNSSFQAHKNEVQTIEMKKKDILVLNITKVIITTDKN